jgi:uncharacterized membrane protein
MLIDLTPHLPAALAFLQSTANTSTAADNTGGALMHLLVRWAHFVAGVAWIGLLYFFNLVNVNFMKALDGPTKKIVVPALMPKALWYFRWGAVVTVLSGLMYYMMYIVPADAAAARLGRGEWLGLLGLWLLVVLVIYAVIFYLYRVPALAKDGRVLGVVIAVLTVVMSWAVYCIFTWKSNNCDTLGNCTYLGTKTISIGIGGGIGILMLLNVWGIIWPAQKRIIAATVAGTPPDATLARRAFLASRTNAWLSLPMLFFMAHSHDYVFFAGK